MRADEARELIEAVNAEHAARAACRPLARRDFGRFSDEIQVKVASRVVDAHERVERVLARHRWGHG